MSLYSRARYLCKSPQPIYSDILRALGEGPAELAAAARPCSGRGRAGRGEPHGARHGPRGTGLSSRHLLDAPAPPTDVIRRIAVIFDNRGSRLFIIRHAAHQLDDLFGVLVRNRPAMCLPEQLPQPQNREISQIERLSRHTLAFDHA